MATCIIFVFLSLIEFAIVNKLLDLPQKTKFGKTRFSKWTREKVMVVDKVSRYLFPFSFLMFVFIFWNMFEGET